jgi:hypothetical protein
MKKRAVCLATSGVVEAQTSTRISASYRTTDPGLPEPTALSGLCGPGADSIRWTRSASEGDTPRMRAVSRRVGNGVLIVTRGLILFDHFPFEPVSHLMWVESDRTANANAEKTDSVVFYFLVHGSLLRQYPTGGTGISCLRQTFAKLTSDMPNSWASVRTGVAQTFS